MSRKKNRCPFCEGKMLLSNSRYKCVKCGYSISGGDAIASNQTNRKDKNEWKIVLPAVFLGISLVIRIGTLVFERIAQEVYNYKEYEYGNYEETAIEWPEEYEMQEESYLPQSEAFQKLVEEVFQKDYTKVTKEEYASITSICFGNDYDVVYKIGDGEEKRIYFGEYLGANMEDLNCFPGLKKLDVTNYSSYVRKEYMSKLVNLEEIAMNESPEALLDFIVHKDKIRSITLGDDFLNDSLNGIEEFSNLKELYIKCSQITDLGCLSNLNQLEVLVIEDGREIGNFGTLSTLEHLKKLSIKSENLKNIDFMQNMKQLEEVSICGSAIKSIEILKTHKDTLKKLTLLENYEVTDYRLLDELTGLEEASLGFGYDVLLPTFQGMKTMKKLCVENAEDIIFVGNASNITELTLADCELEQLDTLKKLKDLKVLHINEAGSYTKSLSPLMELTQLEVLDISETYIYGYVEELLSLPNLQEFYMDECRVAFDFSKLTGNKSLTKLSMNEVELLDYGADYNPEEFYSNGEGKEINISDYAENFQKFPNLTELYLRETGLGNVEFARGLSKLEVLDISDNYVSSVEPLKELANLKLIFCGENDIMDFKELGGNVEIIGE